jgi:hypothetical protein
MNTVDQIVFNFLDMIDYIIKCLFSISFIVYSCPIVVGIVFAQLYYFYILRKRILKITRDGFRLKQTLNAPIISLIQDSMNCQVSMRTTGTNSAFLDKFLQLTDVQTQAFVTSNGVNRFSAYRIDM